jgi:predicted restriction endonuclease
MTGYWTGKKLSPQHRKKLVENHRGRTGQPHTEATKKKLAAIHLGKPKLSIRGVNHPNWKGGITPSQLQARHSLEYKTWRRNVFERDKYICQQCGKPGRRIEAHHIRPFAIFPELRYEVNNGLTLCKECHKKIPKP